MFQRQSHDYLWQIRLDWHFIQLLCYGGGSFHWSKLKGKQDYYFVIMIYGFSFHLMNSLGCGYSRQSQSLNHRIPTERIARVIPWELISAASDDRVEDARDEEKQTTGRESHLI